MRRTPAATSIASPATCASCAQPRNHSCYCGASSLTPCNSRGRHIIFCYILYPSLVCAVAILETRRNEAGAWLFGMKGWAPGPVGNGGPSALHDAAERVWCVGVFNPQIQPDVGRHISPVFLESRDVVFAGTQRVALSGLDPGTWRVGELCDHKRRC